MAFAPERASARLPARLPRASTARGRLLILCLLAAGFALLLLLADRVGISPSLLTPDPNSVSGESTYVGIISTLGVMLWGTIVAACLLAGVVLRSVGAERSGTRLMLGTAALALVLGIDDAAMFHENIAPDTLGVPERAVLVAFAAMALAWTIAFRGELRRSDPVLLLATAACFALSVVVDQFYESRVVEDYFKYVGLLAFAGWAFGEARRRLRPVVSLGRPQR